MLLLSSVLVPWQSLCGLASGGEHILMKLSGPTIGLIAFMCFLGLLRTALKQFD